MEMKWVVFWQTPHVTVTLVFLFIPYFSSRFKLSLSPSLFVISLSLSLLSRRGFRSICSRGVIYSLRGNKRISHISLIFTLHNSTFLSLAPLISFLAASGRSQSTASHSHNRVPNLNMLYVAENSKCAPPPPLPTFPVTRVISSVCAVWKEKEEERRKGKRWMRRRNGDVKNRGRKKQLNKAEVCEVSW